MPSNGAGFETITSAAVANRSAIVDAHIGAGRSRRLTRDRGRRPSHARREHRLWFRQRRGGVFPPPRAAAADGVETPSGPVFHRRAAGFARSGLATWAPSRRSANTARRSARSSPVKRGIFATYRRPNGPSRAELIWLKAVLTGFSRFVFPRARPRDWVRAQASCATARIGETMKRYAYWRHRPGERNGVLHWHGQSAKYVRHECASGRQTGRHPDDPGAGDRCDTA